MSRKRGTQHRKSWTAKNEMKQHSMLLATGTPEMRTNFAHALANLRRQHRGRS